jgi:hypothetical protein
LLQEATLIHVILHSVLTYTIPLTPTPTQRARLQARTPSPAPLLSQRPTRCSARCPAAGGTQIIGQRVKGPAT